MDTFTWSPVGRILTNGQKRRGLCFKAPVVWQFRTCYRSFLSKQPWSSLRCQPLQVKAASLRTCVLSQSPNFFPVVYQGETSSQGRGLHYAGLDRLWPDTSQHPPSEAQGLFWFTIGPQTLTPADDLSQKIYAYPVCWSLVWEEAKRHADKTLLKTLPTVCQEY